MSLIEELRVLPLSNRGTAFLERIETQQRKLGKRKGVIMIPIISKKNERDRTTFVV